MIDKKLESNIKKTKEFIEIWKRFYQTFSNTISHSHVDENKEKEFLSTRDVVNSRYEDLMDSLEVKPLKRHIMTPFVYNIFSIDKISIMSDEKLKEVNKEWEKSGEFLHSLLRRLEKKKDKIKSFNRFAFQIKKKITNIG